MTHFFSVLLKSFNAPKLLILSKSHLSSFSFARALGAQAKSPRPIQGKKKKSACFSSKSLLVLSLHI